MCAQAKGAVDDMVLLSDLKNEAVVRNLRERYFDDKIYTYIGMRPLLRAFVVPSEKAEPQSGADILLIRGVVGLKKDRICIVPRR